jgi:hypothetical protein
MNIKLLTGLVLAGTFLSVPTVEASNDGVSFKVHVSGHVEAECTLRASGSYEQISNDVFRIGSISRFCNTAHQLSLSHTANVSGGTIAFDGVHTPLQDTSVVLIADNGPVNQTDDIIVSGIDAQTAQILAGSLMVQISPRDL